MQFEIRTYMPGDVAHIIERHRALYLAEYDLGGTFADYVDRYMRAFESDNNPAREKLWVLECQGRFAGSIAIVDAGEGSAQLRWFLVEPDMRGRGAGTALVEEALAFCRRAGYTRVFLWTLSILDSALYIYKKQGFILTQETFNNEWREGLTEECYELVLN